VHVPGEDELSLVHRPPAEPHRTGMENTTVLRLRDGFGLDNLKLETEKLPSPGAREVLVRFHAASLNYRDLMVALGHYNPKMELPRILGSDAAGEVVRVGQDVTGWRIGDRVASLFFQDWQDAEITKETGKSALGGSIDGVFATGRVLPETGLIRIPDSLSFEQAATLPCAAVTAWNALVRKGKIRAGQTVLILGTGGVSLFALQIAKASGANVILTSSSDEKLKRGRALGADHTINYRMTPEWDAEVLKMTGKLGVDHVVEVGGSGTLARSLNAVKVGGHVHLIGVLSEPGKGVDVLAVLRKSIHLNGIYVGSRRMFEELSAALAVNKIEPVVDRVFPLSAARAAFEFMQNGNHFGKIVLSMETSP
jgi:NADPH:quinone reductase-like Zn-dependent oxidoreductase